MPSTKTAAPTGLDLVTEHTRQKQRQTIMAADAAPSMPRMISDALRAHVQSYFRIIRLRDFNAVDAFFTWAGDRIHVDPETATSAALTLCDEFATERPWLFHIAPIVEPETAPLARMFVDEPHEVQFYVGFQCVKFRPGEELKGAYERAQAKQYGIRTRPTFERPSAPRPAGSAPSMVVVEEADVTVQVGISWVKFYAGETLTDHKIKLARQHNIAIAER
jgi:hypothetical protein